MGNIPQRIKELDPYVAQRIAAGEVIDRPQAIIRELLDNSIDAGSTTIDVYLEQGGISSIKVIDDGMGMSREDISICYRSHTTSKISTIDDLYAIRTLGFRGEALSSIAACSKLKIISSFDEEPTYTVSILDGIAEGPYEAGHAKGTTIEIRDLFYSIPGRKKFLKSPQAEAAACKKMFIEKALMYPEIQFRLFSNGKLSLFLPKSQQVGRIIDAYPARKFDPVFLHTVEESAGDFSLRLICTDPSLYRTDRSYIQIYVNNRRIDDYALVQAVQYGYTDYLPGGCFPYCFVSITIDPELVDFNIHPAKKEVKLRRGKEIHHQLVETIKHYLYQDHRKILQESQAVQKSLSFSDTPTKKEPTTYQHSYAPRPTYQPQSRDFTYQRPNPSTADWISEAKEIFSSKKNGEMVLPDAKPYDFLYHGQIFGVFLIVEKDESLYLIDQHAAHEKVIYKELSEQVRSQPLLVPIEFDVEEDVDRHIAAHLDAYERLGIILGAVAGVPRRWELSSLPNYARSIEQDIISFIQEEIGSPEEITRSLFATISCRAAIKEGDVIDEHTAHELIVKVLGLELPRCPHGRPIWKEITREELYRAVKRLI